MAEFICDAERNADSINKISEFSGFSLLKVKENVDQLSSLIGQTKEIFSTYSKHDISHVNTMLEYLDWLIPTSTKEILTDADWLLITLSIYFHDLGMVVTKEEYDNRFENSDFIEFIDNIKKDESSDFIARTKKMADDKKEEFFFQEYIRYTHPTRIAKWINGSFKTDQSEDIKKIGEIIDDTLSELPSRFKSHLASVCESHHKDDLTDKERYPLFQSYASNENEATANVQYAALILRTADLLHITHDRTPSVMYKLINFTDPKSVEEWDKQSGTFSVYHKKREFEPDNEETHVIQISADFDREEPFFSLSEYINYAKKQIKQTHIWASKSQEDSNAKGYWFPWRDLEGDLRVQSHKPEKLKFEFDRGSLLDLLVGHAIYNDPTVAIRELMQNSIDAVRFQKVKDQKSGNKTDIGEITVKWNPETRLLTIIDNGTGMEKFVIQNHLMSVGSSYYSTSQVTNEYSDFNPISRFGIGILTCFMVSDDIEIFTFREGEGHRVKMKSVHGNYLLRSISPSSEKVQDIKPHGTKIELQLRNNIDLSERSILDILERWVVLPECDVYYNEMGGHKKKKVGFNSTEEVLKSNLKYHVSDLSDIKIVSKSKKIDQMSVDLSYALSDLNITTNTFFKGERTNRPILTLEGIKVTNTIPWISQYSPIQMVVSVRDSKLLRTTVSRSGLEKDQHYDKLGKICLELIYEHIKDELSNILASKGSPLSKASSIYHILYESLLESVNDEKALEFLSELRSKEKTIVIEKSSSDETDNDAKRKLISPEELKDIEVLWTSESRLIDSLGTISRDLGTELSLSKLFSSLNLNYSEFFPSPILLDAHLLSKDLLKYHVPSSVDFSKEKQHTFIKWEKRSQALLFEELLNNLDLDLTSSEFEILQEHKMGSGFDRISEFINNINSIHVAEASGDDSKISIIYTRTVIILKKDTELANTYLNIKNLISIAYENQTHTILGYLFILLKIIYRSTQDSQSSYRPSLGGDREILNEWQLLTNKINEWLVQIDYSEIINEDLTQLINIESKFDVSRYWRNWLKL